MITIEDYENRLFITNGENVICEECLGDYIPSNNNKNMICQCED